MGVHSINVDYLAETSDFPLVRFATDAAGIVELRDLCERRTVPRWVSS